MGAIHNWRYQFLFIHFHQSPSPKSTLFRANVCKVEKILKGSLDWIPSPSHSEKIQIMGGKVCLRCKTLLGIINKHLKKKVCWHHPAMFCLINPSKLSQQKFEFLLNVKVMGLNTGFILIFFYFTIESVQMPISAHNNSRWSEARSTTTLQCTVLRFQQFQYS